MEDHKNTWEQFNGEKEDFTNVSLNLGKVKLKKTQLENITEIYEPFILGLGFIPDPGNESRMLKTYIKERGAVSKYQIDLMCLESCDSVQFSLKPLYPGVKCSENYYYCHRYEIKKLSHLKYLLFNNGRLGDYFTHKYNL